MRHHFVYALYRLLLPLAMLCMLPGAWLKLRRRGGKPGDIARRLGRFSAEEAALLAASKDCYWFHAVSVGEVNVAVKILQEIRRLEPQRPLVLSSTTTTGQQLALKEVPAGTQVIYSPVDFVNVVRRFLDLLQPSKIILVEAEVWPNLVAQADARHIPVILANARLSPRSARRYRQLRWLIQPVFSHLRNVLVQFPEDTGHWKTFGTPAEKIHLVGSVKYDDSPARPKRVEDFRSLLNSVWGQPLPPLILMASSFPGEELGLLQALQQAGVIAKILLVPRHVERTAALEKELTHAGFPCLRRSQLPTAEPCPDLQAILVDTTGELRDWQFLPQAVVMGRSFLMTGGQNPTEAIAAATPVITGPHMENFGQLMRQLHAADGLVQVADLTEAAAVLKDILAQPQEARERTSRAKKALAVHQGAATRTAAFISNAP